MKKDAPKPQETAAPYKPTPADAQAFDAYMAARAKAAPRLKVVPTAEGAGTITIDHPNKALGQIALMKALGTTDTTSRIGSLSNSFTSARKAHLRTRMERISRTRAPIKRLRPQSSERWEMSRVSQFRRRSSCC